MVNGWLAAAGVDGARVTLCGVGLSSIVKHHRARSFSFAIQRDEINNMQLMKSKKEFVLLDAKE